MGYEKELETIDVGSNRYVLLQSCVTVRKARHRHHHHRHCMVISQQTTNITLFNTLAIYMAMDLATVYEYKG